jgi:hypothetical protein
MKKKSFIQGSLFEKSPVLSEVQVDGILRPIYPQLWRTIMEPWQEFQRYRATDPNFSDFEEEDVAWFLHSLIKPRVCVVFEQNPSGAVVRMFERKPTIVIPNQLAVTIKKLKKRRIKKNGPEVLTRSHYNTPRSRKYYNDEEVDDGPAEPRVIVGYMLLELATKIQIVVANPRVRRKGFLWSYLMPEQSASILQARFTEETIVDEQDEKQFSIESPAVGEETGTDG